MIPSQSPARLPGRAGVWVPVADLANDPQLRALTRELGTLLSGSLVAAAEYAPAQRRPQVVADVLKRLLVAHSELLTQETLRATRRHVRARSVLEALDAAARRAGH